jgi:hypothetical protein
VALCYAAVEGRDAVIPVAEGVSCVLTAAYSLAWHGGGREPITVMEVRCGRPSFFEWLRLREPRISHYGGTEMAIVNNVHKRAAKAAVARLVVHYGCDPGYAAWGVAGGVMEHGLQVGDLGSVSALTRYAAGVARQGEKVSNRQWDQYGEIRALADKLVSVAAKEISSELQ